MASNAYNKKCRNGIQYPTHHLVVRDIMGRALPAGAEIHHVNGKKRDNRPCNLVVCQDHTYHMLIERRTRAYRACGHAGWFKCHYCKRWDAPENMTVYGAARKYHHAACRRDHDRKKYRERTPTWTPKTHCWRGHPLSGDNLYQSERDKQRGARRCRACKAIECETRRQQRAA